MAGGQRTTKNEGPNGFTLSRVPGTQEAIPGLPRETFERVVTDYAFFTALCRSPPGLIFRKPSRRHLDNEDMTAPRQVLPGTTYLITRRCARRQLLIRPSELINQIFLYCLARAAEKTGLFSCVRRALESSAHRAHGPGRATPEFTHWLFEYSSKCVNASLGRWENLWSSEPPSAVRLESVADQIDKILYVMANPTAAALVPKAELWPGVISLPQDYLSGPVEVVRPEVFFRKRRHQNRMRVVLQPLYFLNSSHSRQSR